MNQTVYSAQKTEKESEITNTEISDAMMKAFNEADWDTWRSFMAPDVCRILLREILLKAWMP